MSEPCARCGRPRESLRHDRRYAPPTSGHRYETQEEVDVAFAEAAALFTGKCVHCTNGTIVGDEDGPYCLQCGWRARREPTLAERSPRRIVRSRGRSLA